MDGRSRRSRRASRTANRKAIVGEYVHSDDAPPPPLSRLVDDGLLIAGSAVRIAARNRIILRALRDGCDFDAQWLQQSIRHELETLAAEKSTEHARLAETMALIRPTSKAATDGDLSNLERREQVTAALAERLEQLADDSEWIEETAAVVHANAWDEVADAIVARALVHQVPQQPLDDDERELRIGGLLVDLATLAESAPWPR